MDSGRENCVAIWYWHRGRNPRNGIMVKRLNPVIASAHWGRDRMAVRRYFQINFLVWKVLYFDYYSQWSNFLGANVGLNNSLVSISRQAMKWTRALWIYVSIESNLKQYQFIRVIFLYLCYDLCVLLVKLTSVLVMPIKILNLESIAEVIYIYIYIANRVIC